MITILKQGHVSGKSIGKYCEFTNHEFLFDCHLYLKLNNSGVELYIDSFKTLRKCAIYAFNGKRINFELTEATKKLIFKNIALKYSRPQLNIS